MSNETERDVGLTDEDLAQRGLPPVAFFDNEHGLAACETNVVCVKRGEMGCYAVETGATAAELNQQHGVSEAQREAMLAGSMFGWECKAAYPLTWEARLRGQTGTRH